MSIISFLYSVWVIIGMIGASVAILTVLVPLLSNQKPHALNSVRKERSVSARVTVIICILIVLVSTLIGLCCVRVPDERGVSLSDARNELRKAGLKPEREPNVIETDEDATKLVKWQSLEADSIVVKGSTIYISVLDRNYPKAISYDFAHEESTNKVTVPDVTGMEQMEAVAALQLCGLQFQVFLTGSGIADTYYVVSQSYESGVTVDEGTIVKLELSAEKPSGEDRKYEYNEADSEVKTNTELNGFYLKTVSTTNASFYDAETDETPVVDYIPVRLCHVILNVDGAGESIMSISMVGKNTGLCIDNNNGVSEFYINKGDYTLTADFGSYYLTADISITESGEYSVSFFH